LDSATGITDAGLAHLANRINLEWLGLSSATGVTDAGLAHFSNMTELRVLGINPLSGITHKGVDELRKHCPRLEIVFS